MNPRPDQSSRLTVEHEGGEHSFLLDPVYDRLDYFQPLGFCILKIVDPELGFAQIPMDEAMMGYVAEEASLPVVERDFITVREHDLYIRWQMTQLDGWMND